MTINPSYRKAFYYAISLHLFIVVLLLVDTSSTKQASLTMEAKNSPSIAQPQIAQQQEVVKAVSVDNREVMETVNRLKNEREQKLLAEKNRQNQLMRQAELAKQQRIKEQQELARLKEEANKIAIARKKQAEDEKKHLKELAEQKIKEAKRIEELKKQQEELVKKRNIEAKKLAELNKKKAEEAKQLKIAQENAAKAERARIAKAKADADQKMQAAAAQAKNNAENEARIAGEVDKYKALIVNAIGKNWILPENVDSRLSSQFRIRLAPGGMVLEVSLIRSSGDPLLDRSAQTAIRKASPLPVPSDAEIFNKFRDISLTVRPEHVRG